MSWFSLLGLLDARGNIIVKWDYRNTMAHLDMITIPHKLWLMIFHRCATKKRAKLDIVLLNSLGPTDAINTWILVNIVSSRPGDGIWRQITGSTLAQVMAYCLTAPSHYLKQCWLIINKVLWLSCEGNFTRDASITKICLKITCLKFHSNFPGANELMVLII